MTGAGRFIAVAAALLTATPALARIRPFDIIPLPVPRPAFQSDAPEIPVPPPRPAEAPAPAVSEAPAATAEQDAACQALMQHDQVLATRLPPIVGPGGCGIANPVELSAIKTEKGLTIDIVPPIRVRCELAQALAGWVRDDLISLTAAAGELRRIVDADAYECRGRNRVAGAKLSEHGKGNAVDIVSLAFADGHVLTLTAKDAGEAVTAIKGSACKRFTTVLGPGSDGYHENHVHLDLEARRNGAHLCEWTLPADAVPTPTP